MLAVEPRITEGTLKTPDGRVLPLEWTKVQVAISGPLATVEVRQRFKNITPDTLEATYLFPLPHQASVFRMEFRIGERVVKGVVKEKEEARRAYQAARAQGRAATLLEQDRPNLFTLSVANIAPDSHIEVLLEYQELVTFDQDEWRFVFPMVASDRYHSSDNGAPPSGRIRPPRARQKDRVSPISLDLKLTGLSNLHTPHSPSHSLSVQALGNGFELQLSDTVEVANKDFVLVWTSKKKGLLPQAWFERKPDKPGTFCVVVPAPALPDDDDAPLPGKGIGCGNCGAPMERKDAVEEVSGMGPAWRCEYCGVYQPVEPSTVEPKNTGKDVVFLIDQSASMGNLDSIAKVVLGALEKLGENDAFRIISFHHQLSRLWGDWLPCDESSREQAAGFLSQLRTRGGTELEVALRAAAEGERPNRTRVVVLITDAAVGNEGRLLKSLPKWLGSARLYVLGLGPSVNRYLIDKLALHGRGACDVAVANEPEVLARFARRVAEAGPVLTDVSISWADSAAMDIYPRGSLDLFSGQSIRVTGRYVVSGSATLLVTGKTPQGTPFRQELSAMLPETDERTPGLERVWARQRIDDLQDQLTRQPERLSDVRLEVLGLALKHQLMSPYTALVAEDSEVSVDPSALSRTVEVELPAAEPAEPASTSSAPLMRRRSSALFGSGGSAPAPAAAAIPADAGLFDEPCESADLFGGGPAGESLFSAEEVAPGDGWLGSASDEEVAPGGGWLGSASDDLVGTVESSSLFDDDDFSDSWCDDEFGELESEPVPAPVPPSGLFDKLKSAISAAPRKSVSPPAPISADPDPWEGMPPPPPPTPRETIKPYLGRRGTAPEGARPVPGQTPATQKTVGQPRVNYSEEELARARDMVKGRLDLVFLIDETGSMGPYIQEVQEHLFVLIEAVRQSPLCRVLRLGLVTFRDHPPQDTTFVTRVVPLTEDIEEIRTGVNRMRAAGGGDGPEAVTDGLHELLNLNWDPDSARLVVMVGDAPPHGVEPYDDGFPEGCPCGHHWFTQAESCREMGITVHTVGCQGIASFVGAVQVFQSVAATTGGLYVPLNHAHLLIGLVTGLADREFDRQRLTHYVGEVYDQHRAALEQADSEEQVRFITETLVAQSLEVLDLKDGLPGQGLEFRPVTTEDVKVALQSALRNRILV